MPPLALPPLDADGYHTTTTTQDEATILAAFLGQILAFQTWLRLEQPALLAQTPNPEVRAFIAGIDGCITERLLITAAQYHDREPSTILGHYTTLWGDRDARFVLTSLCNACYRLLSISVPGLLTLFMQHDPTIRNDALMALQQRLSVITQIITDTQIALQGAPGYIEGPPPMSGGRS